MPWRGIDATYTIKERPVGRFTISLEFKPADLWIGAYTASKGGRRHWWICPLPTLVIHVS